MTFETSEPPVAAAVGYNTLTFFDDFDSISTIDAQNTGNASQYKWFTANPGYSQGAVLPASDISVTNSTLALSTDVSGVGYGISTFDSSNKINWSGTGFANGFYIEINASFDPSLALRANAPDPWPALWMEGYLGIAGRNVELDLFEAIPSGPGTIAPSFFVNDWVPNAQGVFHPYYLPYGKSTNATLGNPDYSQMNTYGTLWVPAADNGGIGLIERFFNGVLIPSETVTYTPGVGNYATLDSDIFGLILGAGKNWPLNVGSVEVWQASVSDAITGPGNDSITANLGSVTADGTSTITLTVTVEYANGDPVAGTTVMLSASGTDNIFSAITGVTDATGVFTATLASNVAQTEIVTAMEGSTQETTSVTFVSSAVIWANGINGTWQTALYWTPNRVPEAGDSVFITASGTYTVTDPQTTTVYSLATAANAILDITGGTFTIYAGTDTGANAGTVEVEAGATLDILPSMVTNTGALTNAGVLDLDSATVAGGSLSNAGTVDSTGTSALNGVAVINAGLMEATSGTLTIDPNTVKNTGTLEATTGGTLDLQSVAVTNTGGTVEVDIASILDLNNTTITGGTLSHAGTVDVTGGTTSTLTGVGVTNTGMTVTTSTPLALDGNGFTNKSVPTTSASVTLTTHSANDVIIVDVVQNGASVSSVTDAAGLVWHQRALTGTVGQTIYEYYAIAANALSSDAIIVNFAGAASYVDLNAFGVSGANTSSPFDSNVSVPASPASSTGSITTSNANDLIVAGYRFGSDAAPAAGAGWTAINASGNYYLSEYQIVSATRAGLVATASTGDENGGVIDAIVQAPASVSTIAGAMTVDASSTLDLNNTTINGGTLSNAGTVDVTGGATSTLDGVSFTNAGGSMTVVAPFGLDGNGFANKAAPTTSASVSLTTTHTNDVIILDIVQNSASVSSVTDTAGLAWHQRAVTGTGVQTIYEYYAIAANALSSDVITVNFAGAASYVDLNAFGVSGANTSSPFDSNVSVPATPAASTGAVTTSNANDFIVAGYRFGSDATPAAGSGWTAINASGDYYLSEYKIVSSTQAGLVATASTGDENGGIVDAIVQAVAPPPSAGGALTVDAGSTLDLNNTTISGGALSNAGTVGVTGSSTSTLKDVSVTDNGATLTVEATATLDLSNATITGGTLGNAGTLDSTENSALDGVAVTNSSLLEVTRGTLTIDPSEVTNTGTLEATTGGTLDLQSVAVTNTGGTVEVDTTSTLDLHNTTITGATLSNAGTVDVTGGATSTLDGVTVTNTSRTVTSTIPLALDGNGFSSVPMARGESGVTLTTTKANDVIILYIAETGTFVENDGDDVFDTAGLTWSQVAATGTGASLFYEYTAIAPTPLSQDAITAIFANTGLPIATNVVFNAFAISGANVSAPFDTNVSVPAVTSTSTAAVTTSNANDFIFTGYQFSSNPVPSAGAGWTAINATGGNFLSEYQIVSATQSGLAATASTGDENGGIVAAVVQNSAPVATAALTVDAGSTLDLKNTTINGGTLINFGTVDVTGGSTSVLNGVNVGTSMIALDGNAFQKKFGDFGGTPNPISAKLTLTTTQKNDVIIFDIVQNGSTVRSVSDTASLVWHQRAVAGTGLQTIYEYYAIAPDALSSDAITVNFNNPVDYIDLNAFGISGADTSNPFDRNLSLPATPSASTGSITTNNTIDFIFAAYRFAATAFPGAGPGWTPINANDGNYMSEYQIVSSTQAGLVATASAGDENGGIVDAVVSVAAPSGVLIVDASSTLDLSSTTITGGTMTNAGTLDVTGNSTSSLNAVGVTNTGGSETIDAGSTLDLSSTTTITGGSLSNSGTVDSTGTSALNGVAVINAGLMEATSGTLTIDPNTVKNTGTLEATTGGTLDLQSVAVTNTGGTVEVDIASILDLNNTTITGGTLSHAGTVDVTGGTTSTLTGVGVTNTGMTVTTSTPLALDGNGFTNKSVPTTSASVTLTTHSANDVIIVDVVQNGASVSSVTDAAGLVWHQRALTGTVGQTIYEYYAIAANALSSDAIIVNFAGAASYVDLNAFGVSGANTSSPFDSNVSVPASPASSTGSITTSNANDLIVAGYRFGSDAAPAAGAGWTAINASGNYYLSEYQIVSATRAGLVATASTGDENGGVIDAIVQAPASVSTIAGAMTVDASSTLDLNNTTINGGTLSNAGTVDVTGGATSTLDGVSFTNAGGSMTVVAPFGLDGNGFANKAAPTTSASVSLTTTHTNDVIILDIVQNSASVSSVTDTAGLVWHQRAVTGTGVQTIYEYYAIAANALSSDVITVNFAGAASYVDLNAFGVSGANTSSPFDSNVSVPATPAASTGAVTTSNANDFIVAGYRFGSDATPAAGSGWTAINASGDYYLSEYKIVSSTQAGLVATASTGDENGGIVDAIVQAVAPPPSAGGALTVDAGSTLDLNNTTISGGALSNAGTVDSTGTSALNEATVTNSSLLEVTGGQLTINAAVTDTGNLLANNGATLDITGAVTGSGTATISGTNSVLEFGAASAESTTFSAAVDAMLKLDNASGFTGTVAGLATGDSIDLANFLFSGNPIIAGVTGTGAIGTTTDVTVHDQGGAQSVTLHLLNQSASQFAVDPTAYSLVADNNAPNHGTLFQLVAPM